MKQSIILSESERIKTSSHGLYDPVAQELGDVLPYFNNDAEQVLKHHGVYQQDNRDIRSERKKSGLGPEHSLMVRLKLPAGRITADQYLLCDQLSDRYGQGDLRVTSRQGLQFHGVKKHDLRPIIHDLNLLARLTTLGAAGDVVRNVVASPIADIDPRYGTHGPVLIALAQAISQYFCPKTSGYHEIWMDDQRASVHADGTVVFEQGQRTVPSEETLYGHAYLPRKFKIAIATDFDNSVDAYTNDIGLIAVMDGNQLAGFEVLVGGGLGHISNRSDRDPKLGSHFAFVSQEEVLPLLDAIVKVFRDEGNRSDRLHARLRFLIEKTGIEPFRELVETAARRSFPPPRMIDATEQYHYLGWSRQIQPGLNYAGILLENGRIRDQQDGPRYKSALREAVKRFSPEIRYTPHHNIILANIRDADVEPLDALLRAHGIDIRQSASPLRQWEMACPALPLCSRALAEAERVLPTILSAIEQGVGGDADIIIRMSGCPNNCSRPRTAEIGIIARNRHEYVLYAGGNRAGTRLNEMLLDNVPGEAIAQVLVRMIKLWQEKRCCSEHFGDWVCRIGLDSLRMQLTAE